MGLERYRVAWQTRETILHHAEPRQRTAVELIPYGNLNAAPMAVGDLDFLAIATRGTDSTNGYGLTRDGYYMSIASGGIINA